MRWVSKNTFYVVLFFFTSLTSVSLSHPPQDLENYKETSTRLRQIPDGAIVEGSAGYGGIQPDYLIDTDNPTLKSVLNYGEKLKKKKQDEWKKIGQITKFVQTKVLPNTDYEYPAYLELNSKYRLLKKQVPLSEYVKCEAGVCREYSLVTHLLMDRAGIPNHHAYAKIHRSSRADDYDIVEDHGFTVVLIEGEEWVVDPYYRKFHGFLLKDLTREEGITPDSKVAPIGKPEPGFRKIIKLHKFPRVWTPQIACDDPLKKISPSSKKRSKSN